MTKPTPSAEPNNRPTSRSPYPSRLVLPRLADPLPKLSDYLHRRFPGVSAATWEKRMADGKIHDDTGNVVDNNQRYQPGLTLIYYREVQSEPMIPFKEKILFQDEHILVACKPHFLPVVPGGAYVNECLVYRLRKETGRDDLVPLHRLDRATAGLVLFSTNTKTRGAYAQLFERGTIGKQYDAIGLLPPNTEATEWLIESRIVKSENSIAMINVEGKVNARSKIRLIESQGGQGRFALEPLTGKTHQLRLHMTMIGSQIVNDCYYPTLLPLSEPDYERPLKLLARELSFEDPLTGEPRRFTSKRQLYFGS